MTQRRQLSYRQIQVGRFPVGLTGLDEIFQSLFDLHREPENRLGLELVQHARGHNYIPTSAEADYAAALLREYQLFCEQQESGKPRKREMWQGIPREQVPWFPVLDESRCDGCDKCLKFCSNGVYAKRDTGTPSRHHLGGSGTVYVAQAMNCTVGCDACARLCRYRAITFPPRSMLHMLKGR
jgi:NAD-dependent dihydropyrimidine dehydrogenase PreA subunit